MSVQMMCPSLKCRKLLQVSDDARGKLVQCQHCQTKFRVPGPLASAPVKPNPTGKAA